MKRIFLQQFPYEDLAQVCMYALVGDFSAWLERAGAARLADRIGYQLEGSLAWGGVTLMFSGRAELAQDFAQFVAHYQPSQASVEKAIQRVGLRLGHTGRLTDFTRFSQAMQAVGAPQEFAQFDSASGISGDGQEEIGVEFRAGDEATIDQVSIGLVATNYPSEHASLVALTLDRLRRLVWQQLLSRFTVVAGATDWTSQPGTIGTAIVALSWGDQYSKEELEQFVKTTIAELQSAGLAAALADLLQHRLTDLLESAGLEAVADVSHQLLGKTAWQRLATLDNIQQILHSVRVQIQ